MSSRSLQEARKSKPISALRGKQPIKSPHKAAVKPLTDSAVATAPLSVLLPVSKIQPNPDQPRKAFNEQAHKEMIESIKADGVLQPIIVSAVGDHYQIIAGERRYRAAVALKLQSIPAIVREGEEQSSLRLSIVENVQRQNLTHLEEAAAYARLRDQGYSQREIGGLVGKTEGWISTCFKLLEAEKPVQQAILDKEVTSDEAAKMVRKAKATGKKQEELLADKRKEKANRKVAFKEAAAMQQEQPHSAINGDVIRAIVNLGITGMVGAAIQYCQSKTGKEWSAYESILIEAESKLNAVKKK